MPMSQERVSEALQQTFGINIQEITEADPGSAHNLNEEWSATVEKVTTFMNRVAVQTKPGGGTGTQQASGKK